MPYPLEKLQKEDIFTWPAFQTAFDKKHIKRVRIRTVCPCRLYFKQGQYHLYTPSPDTPSIEVEFKYSAQAIALVEALDDECENVGYTPLTQIDDRIVNFF